MICVGYSKKTPFMDMLEQVGIKEQNDRIREFASKNKIKIIRFYEDKSDDPDSDTGFQELRKDGMNRRFDLIIFESLSRFGPNPGMAKSLLLDTFSVIGINFIVLEDQFDSRKADKQSLTAYFDSSDLKYNQLCWKYSLINKYGTDRYIYFCREKYGYKLNSEGTGFVVNEETAKIIRLIFSMANEYSTFREIAKYLNDNNVPVPSLSSCSHNRTEKQLWCGSVVNKLIRNRCYAGYTEKSGVTFPPIISIELFESVNRKHCIKKKLNPEDPLVREIRKRLVFIDPNRKFKFRIYKRDKSTYKAFSLENRSLEVEMNTILAEVRNAVIAEQKLCWNVLSRLDDLSAMRYWETLVERDFKCKAREIYERCVDIQKDNIPLYIKLSNGEITEEEYLKYHSHMIAELEPLDDQLNEIIAVMKKRKRLFSKDNPWILRFTAHVVPESLTPDDIKRYVSSITVRDDGSVYVNLLNTGKEAFGDFVSEGDSYGA